MSNLVGAEDAVKTFEEKDKAERLAKTAASAAKSKGKKKPVKEASDDEMSEDRLSKPSVASKKRAAPESDSSEKSYGMRERICLQAGVQIACCYNEKINFFLTVVSRQPYLSDKFCRIC